MIKATVATVSPEPPGSDACGDEIHFSDVVMINVERSIRIGHGADNPGS